MEHSPFWEDRRQVYPGSPPCSSDVPPPHQGLAQSLGIQPQGLTELPTEMSVCDQQLPCRKSSPRVREQEQKPPWICRTLIGGMILLLGFDTWEDVETTSEGTFPESLW